MCSRSQCYPDLVGDVADPNKIPEPVDGEADLNVNPDPVGDIADPNKIPEPVEDVDDPKEIP